jgi:hypothetical protein
MERRKFIQLAALAAADIALIGPFGHAEFSPSPTGQFSVPVKKGKVVVCLAPHAPDVSRIRLLDWDTRQFSEVSIPIGLVHSVVQDRADRNVIYLFELFGSFVKFNLSTGAFVKIDHKGSNDMFNGHGALSASGEFIACTEISKELGSVVTIRSTENLKKVAETPKECKNSHQIVALPASDLMACGSMRAENGNETGAITFYDFKLKKVMSRVEFPFPILHVLALSSTEVIGLTLQSNEKRDASNLSWDRGAAENQRIFNQGQSYAGGPLYYVSVEGNHKTLWDEQQKSIFNNNFGLAGVSKMSFLSGHHGSGKVIFWKDFKIAHIFTVPEANNLVASKDGSEFMAISGQKLQSFSLKDFSQLKDFNDWPPVVSFSSYNA